MHAQKDMDEQYENIMLKIKKRRGIVCNVHEGGIGMLHAMYALGCTKFGWMDPFKLFCCEASTINWACRFLEQGHSEGEVAFRVGSLDRRDCHVFFFPNSLSDRGSYFKYRGERVRRFFGFVLGGLLGRVSSECVYGYG